MYKSVRTNDTDLLKFYLQTQIAIVMRIVVIIIKTTKKLLIAYIQCINEWKTETKREQRKDQLQAKGGLKRHQRVSAFDTDSTKLVHHYFKRT